ncbi:unnamed protein product [Moneuplotes crassus]|uniref:Uncharacterized protein n=1 Tax=Euplotes crassus TaxID=5936 RepID=A0AAD1UJ14_EUPCR|nr:unnamed protein product [Moneuplotes crassus]
MNQYTKLINSLYPSVMDFSGKKVKSVLKFHLKFNSKENIVNETGLREFIQREKEIIELRAEFIKEGQEFLKPKFLEMIENFHKECPKETSSKFEVYKAKTKPLAKPFQSVNTRKYHRRYEKIPEYCHGQSILTNSQRLSNQNFLLPPKKLCKTSPLTKNYYIQQTCAYARSKADSMANHYRSLQKFRKTIQDNFSD